jgi:hypothetical protein
LNKGAKRNVRGPHPALRATFPRKAEILRGFPVSPLAKLILTNQGFGKITGEGFWMCGSHYS